MVTVNITVSEDAEQIVRNLQTMPKWLLDDIAKSMISANQLTVGHIDQAYLSFPKSGPSVAIGCRVQTNRLRGSIRASKAVISGQQVVSGIGSNVVYAAAQEFGADIPARTIVPKPGNKALRFMIGDRVIFATSVKMPAVHLPARGFVQRGIADRAANYTSSISRAIIAGWNANKTN